jgi:hypothetical protein
MRPIEKVGKNFALSLPVMRRLLELYRPIIKFLRKEDPLQPSEAIFVFGSDRTCVAKKAAELLRRMAAPRVLFTGGTGGRFGREIKLAEAEYLRRYALSLHIPQACILTETESSNTEENIRFGLKTLRENGVDLSGQDRTVFGRKPTALTLLLVSLPYQQLRQWATFEWLKKDPSLGIANLQLINCPANYSLKRNSDLKVFMEDVERVLGEVEKILQYRNQHFIWLAVPENVLIAYHQLKELVDRLKRKVF